MVDVIVWYCDEFCKCVFVIVFKVDLCSGFVGKGYGMIDGNDVSLLFMGLVSVMVSGWLFDVMIFGLVLDFYVKGMMVGILMMNWMKFCVDVWVNDFKFFD